jgi:uncharacterized NAD(P)/FAD-binding protein YdhS
LKTLVVIGAGFSGAVTAIHFARACTAGTRVILLNRSGEMARGLAYGTNSSRHLLNVPAGNMSALADEPDHFLRFCESRLPSTTASSFVPRKLYGEYLSSLLADAERACRPGVSFERIVDEAHLLDRMDDKTIVRLASGRELIAEHVVLAFGNFSPLNPAITAVAQAESRYIADPWSGVLDVPINPQAPILLLGAGLTALDVALTLDQIGHTGPVYILSRRGLRPLPHRASRQSKAVAIEAFAPLLECIPTVLNYLRNLRALVAAAALEDIDWRDIVGAMRPITSDLWGRLDDKERRRFLRHVQIYWDVHRHRVAPASFSAFSEQIQNGRIRPLAGRIRGITPLEGRMQLEVGLRGTGSIELIEVCHIINCTGPNSNLANVQDRLIDHLRRTGLIQPDNLGIGICVDESLAIMDESGVASTWLSYIGPMLKGKYWEATAVPELRVFARDLAARITAKMG